MKVGDTINLVSNYYGYNPSTLISMQTNEYKVLFGKDYWLANEFIDTYTPVVTSYGIRIVTTRDGVGGSTASQYLVASGGNARGSVRKFGIMPMVYLKNGISLVLTDEKKDGYNVWDIAQ